MECELELGGDGEPIDNYHRELLEADHIRRCHECDSEIPIGTIHEVVTGSYEGEEIDWRTCMNCAHIAVAFQTEGRIHGTLWSELEDYGGDNSDGAFDNFNSACLARVETAAAKAYLQARYIKWKGL
jgi:hypothetical protein